MAGSKPTELLPQAASLAGALVHVVVPDAVVPDLYHSRQAAVEDLSPAPVVVGYRYGGFASANILADEILLDHVVTKAHTLQADFAGCGFSVGTPPDAAYTLTVLLDGVAIGTINISAAGVITRATVGNVAKAVAVGQVVTLKGPAVANGAIARLRYTFEGVI